MSRETNSFGNPLIGQTGALRTKSAPILFARARALALALAVFSPAFASKPVTVQPKSVPTQKNLRVESNNSVAHGKKLFERLTCAGCHPNGENTLHPYRPLKGPGFLARYREDGKIELLIRTGVPRAGMPSFSKAQVGDKDMKDLIAYIRSLTSSTKK